MQGSFKALPSTVLSQLGRHWLEEQRAKLEAHEVLKGHLSGLQRAQTRLLAVEKLEEDLAAHDALSAVIVQLNKTDAQHDEAVRFIGRGLEFAEQGAKHLPERLDLYQKLRERLLPTALNIVTASYAEEIGQARGVEEKLTTADRALMKKIGTPEGNLADAQKTRLESALALDKLEQERIKLEAELADVEGKGALVNDARNYWIRTFRSTLNQIEVEDMDDKDRLILLMPFEKALARTIGKDDEPKPE